MNEIEKLNKAWEYEFKTWMGDFGSTPIRLVDSYDESRDYDLDRGHIFELQNGKFAYVSEAGCSCYDVNDAAIFIFETEVDAKARFLEDKINAQRNNY